MVSESRSNQRWWQSSLGRWLSNVSILVILIGGFIAFAFWSAPPEPTEEERAAAYARIYKEQLRQCHNDYPYQEQILAESGQTYEECAEWRTLIAMDIWEAYYPTSLDRRRSNENE